MKRLWIVLGCTLGLCLETPAAEDQVVARIGDEVITGAQFEKILTFYAPETRAQMGKSPNFRREVLEKYVEALVLAKKAREKGLGDVPDVRERIRLAESQVLASALLDEEVTGRIALSDDDVKRFYDEHLGQFTKPEAVRIRQILSRAGPSATADERQRAKTRADEARKKLEEGADFAALAAEFTDDPAQRSRGGSLGLVARGSLAPAIEKKVFTLEPGQVSEVLETPYGYSIIKVDEKKKAAPEPFEAVRERARALALLQVKQRRLAEYRAAALKQAGVVLYPDRPDEEATEPPHRHPSRQPVSAGHTNAHGGGS